MDTEVANIDVIEAIAIQPDGKIIIGGRFFSVNGRISNAIMRLNADGSSDISFDTRSNFYSQIYSIAVQPNGKIIIGGNFNIYEKKSSNIARLNKDGSLDNSFNPGTGFNSLVNCMTIQPDGKIIVGGDFSTFNEKNRNRIVRLNADGSLDTSFDLKIEFDDDVNCVALQPDGKIIVGGSFSFSNETSNSGAIIRLNEDGSLDTLFYSGVRPAVYSLVVQPDGKIIVGGSFSFSADINRESILRLNDSGSLDTSFDTGDKCSGSVRSLALQPDGKITAGGWIYNYGDGYPPRSGVIRLINSGTDTLVACDSLTWMDGNTYTSSNNSATHTVTNDIGYDSLVFLDLTITRSTSGTDVISTCDSLTWIDGNTYTSSNNTASYILTNAAGCDSVVTLDLTITNSTTETDKITTCDSLIWIDGNTYTSSNETATYTLTNAAGCDSVVTLNLTITNPTTGTDIITTCDSLEWIDGKTYTSSNDTATYILTNAEGCDSVVTLNLTVYSLSDSSASTTLNDKTITANNTNATYQWVDCDNENITIPEETSQHFTATNKGYFAVEITENGCVDTSACVEVIPEIPCDPLEIGFYPNPSTDIITFQVNCSIPSLKVKLFNSLGQLISMHQLHGAMPSLQLPENSGLYLLEIWWGEKHQVHRVVKY